MFYRSLSLALVFTVVIGCGSAARPDTFHSIIQDLEELSVPERADKVRQFFSENAVTPIIDGDSAAHFMYYGKAASVQIRGDKQAGWSKPDDLKMIDCGEEDLFYISYSLPADAQLEYQFVVDGATMLDPSNPNVELHYEFGDRNVMRMPDFKPSPYIDFRGGVPKGSIQMHVFRSNNPEFADRKLEVYTPNGYDEKMEYPVLFVHDGNFKLYQTPFKNILDNMIHMEVIPPIITVFAPNMERWKEYCMQDREYAKIVAEEMVPFIKERVSTSDDPNDWGTMGSSMGGSVSMVIGLLYPDVIANVGAQGGAGGLSYCHDEEENMLEAYLEVKDEYPLNIFASVGTYDLEFPGRGNIGVKVLHDARAFHKKLTALNIEHVYKEFNDGHRDSNWNHTIDDILLQFYGR